MVNCCHRTLKYADLDLDVREKFEGLDPTKGDGEFTCEDVDKFLMISDTNKQLEFFTLAKRFSTDLNDWFRFNFPRQFSVTSDENEKYMEKIVGAEHLKNDKSAQQFLLFLNKYKGALVQMYLTEKKEAQKSYGCAGGCLTYSAIVGFLLKDEFGLDVTLGESNSIFHRWVEVEISGKSYILDFTADQFDNLTEADVNNTMSPVLIPREQLAKEPYLNFLYGKYSEVELTELNKDFFRKDIEELKASVEASGSN